MPNAVIRKSVMCGRTANDKTKLKTIPKNLLLKFAKEYINSAMQKNINVSFPIPEDQKCKLGKNNNSGKIERLKIFLLRSNEMS